MTHFAFDSQSVFEVFLHKKIYFLCIDLYRKNCAIGTVPSWSHSSLMPILYSFWENLLDDYILMSCTHATYEAFLYCIYIHLMLLFSVPFKRLNSYTFPPYSSINKDFTLISSIWLFLITCCFELKRVIPVIILSLLVS